MDITTVSAMSLSALGLSLSVGSLSYGRFAEIKDRLANLDLQLTRITRRGHERAARTEDEVGALTDRVDALTAKRGIDSAARLRPGPARTTLNAHYLRAARERTGAATTRNAPTRKGR